MNSETNQNSPAAQDPASGEPGIAVENETVAQAPDQDPIVQLRNELENAKTDADQWHDRCLRKAAEFENYRKRSERERQESAALVKSSVLAEFLPVMDACERAHASFMGSDEQPVQLKSYREGVELLYKQLGDTLSRLGVVPLETKGVKFDPHLHEALVHQETAEHEDDTVMAEVRRGYMFKERLLRPAQVIVARAPKPKTE
jgi:molecular chaperone GrpE